MNKKDEVKPDSTPSRRGGLRPKKESALASDIDAMDEAMKPLTDEERKNWKGWAELESDPVGSIILYISFL